MTLVNMSKAIFSRAIKIAKFYNEKPVTFFISIGVIIFYFFLISNGFNIDLGRSLEKMLLGNSNHPSDIYAGWGLMFIHLLILFLVTKKIKK